MRPDFLGRSTKRRLLRLFVFRSSGELGALAGSSRMGSRLRRHRRILLLRRHDKSA
jgi:hypothetical protein